MTELEHLEFEIALLKDLVAAKTELCLAKDRIILEMEESCYWSPGMTRLPPVSVSSAWDGKPFPPIVTCATTSSTEDGKCTTYGVDYDNFGDTLARSAGS